MASNKPTCNGLLLASPAAMADKSVASWIQHVCAMHQYSFTRISSILGFMPSNKDWDNEIDSITWSNILQRTACPESTCSLARNALVASRKLWAASMTRLANYRWCIRCLEEDQRPYLRWWWNIKGSDFCPTHRNILSFSCIECGGSLILDRALMVAAGSHYAIPDFRFCQHCGMPRGGSRYPASDRGHVGTRSIGVQKTYIENPGGSAVILRSVLNDGDIRGRSGRLFYGDLSDTLSEKDLDYLRTRKDSYQRDSANSGSSRNQQLTTDSVCWSRQIPRSLRGLRLKIAYALAVVRKDRIRERNEAKKSSNPKTNDERSTDGLTYPDAGSDAESIS